MKQKTKQLIMTLVALLALTTHAWAEQSETIETKADDEIVVYDDYTGTHFKITASLGSNDDGIILWNNSTSGTAKIEALNGEIITKIEMYFRNGGQHATLTTTTEGNLVATESEYADNNISVTDINATSVTIGTTYSTTELAWGQIDKFVIHYANPVPLNWDATAKTASIAAMPAGNVTVNVKYFAQAELAESGAPTAINDVPATTDGPIVTAGTVKNIGQSEIKQGTLMYYASQTAMTDAQLLALTADQWSANVPTAADLAKGAAYVYYYIQGAEPAQGTERTDANTCSDGDILAANVVNVTLAPEPSYTVIFAEGIPEREKWSAAPNTGVKKGQTVTVTYTGDRKVIGVKAEKKAKVEITINGEGQSVTLDVSGCTKWNEVITKNSDKIEESQYDTIQIKGDERYYISIDGEIVSTDDDFDPNATYTWGQWE